MINVTVTGATGFIGSNLIEAIGQSDGITAFPITRGSSLEDLAAALSKSDAVIHLAGSNRPTDPSEFYSVNQGSTEALVDLLLEGERRPPLLFSSSTQADDSSDYGRSKRAGEEAVERYGTEGGSAFVYRLPNVFGKWCRPNYNSAVATFCHNIARGNSIDVHDPDAKLRLVHVSDVVQDFLSRIASAHPEGTTYPEVAPTFESTVGHVADTVRSFPTIRKELLIPDLSDRLTELLHSTFLSYLPDENLQYPLLERVDNRGKLAELIKSCHGGQIFVSTTHPGIVRGNHSHRVKVEKFVVLSGEGVIRIRRTNSTDITEVRASGSSWTVVDIPPGTLHNIENEGETELLVLFWSAEVFDREKPDTYYGKV